MCLICLEFNKSKDFEDASRMIEAARREVNVISESHLRKLEEELRKRKTTRGAPQTDTLEIADDLES